MSGLSVSGIASGIDSKSIISQMVSLETRSITKYQQRIALEEAERIAFEDLSSRLQSLKSSVDGFSADSLFSSLSATSSDESVVSVSATDAAPRGNHSVRVLQTAQAHRIGGSGVADPISTQLGAGFSVKDYGTGTQLSSVGEGSKEINTTATSTFDYDSNVQLSGQYNGDDNVSISVELLSDVSGPNGTVDLRISTDGETYQTHTGVNVVGGVISLDSVNYFDNNGLSMTIDNAGNSMKDGDSVMFRARAKASIEYTVGNGERKEITLDSDETLAEMVKKVNDDQSLGLRADILNDGSASNSYRLLLTSLTEGSGGEINVLHNSSVMNLDGVSAESPVAQSNTYTGEASLSGTLLSGAGNSSIVVEMMDGGTVGAATFKISSDSGLTFHDNNGAGFTLTGPNGTGDYTFDLDGALKDNGDAIFASALDIDLTLSNDGSQLSSGDRITVDLFDSEVQSARDALINVDGITLVKSGNTIDDVFEGLTLNLQNADPDQTVNINISENVGDVTSVMNGFVESYNSVMSLIHAQSKYNPEEDSEAPLLMGDATVRRIQSNLQNFITSRLNDFGSGPSALVDLGISSDSKTGQLNFDSAKLSEALNGDPNGVRRLLSSFGEVVEGSQVSFLASSNATKSGVYNVKVTQARTRAAVTAGSDAQTINSNERLSFRINSDAQGTGNVQSLIVDLTIGMTANQQVSTLQNAFDARDAKITASLENGKIAIRHNEYGDDYKLEVTSDLASGESGFTNVTSSNTGTDLLGTINGVQAEVSGDTLIGKNGYGFEGLRVRVSNDFVGEAGQVSLSEGLGASFSSLLDSFVGFGGLLSNKIDSFDSVISRFEEQMNKVTARATRTVTLFFDSVISRFEEQMNKVTARATRIEERLRQQFVDLEVTLGRLNSTGEYLVAQLQNLPGVQRRK